jgi:hypothetical protein
VIHDTYLGDLAVHNPADSHLPLEVVVVDVGDQHLQRLLHVHLWGRKKIHQFYELKNKVKKINKEKNV